MNKNRKNKKNSKSYSKLSQKKSLIISVLAFAIIGAVYLIFVNAATPNLTIYNTSTELSQLKTDVTKAGYKQSYWTYVKNRPIASATPSYQAPLIPANWSQSSTWTYFDGVTKYSFNPKVMRAVDHPNDDSVDTQGNYMITGATNAYTCGLRWYVDGNTACGNTAVNYIDAWSTNFQYAQSRDQVDIRDNQVKLNSGWYVIMMTRAAETVWNHPNFTTEKKQKFANWLWTAFLNQDPTLNEVSSEVLGGGGVGWNGRTLWMQARLSSGLVMKATGHTSGETVISDIRTKINLYLPEILYYGKAPWHESLGSPWPNQAYLHLSSNYGGLNTNTGTRNYWFFNSNSTLPPRFFVGQSQETGRDLGHHQMGAGSVVEMLKALRINGYGDRFVSGDLGSIMHQMGERHAKFYNEALDQYWKNPAGYGTLEGLSGKWMPSEWANLQLSKDKNTITSFKVGGSSADAGWEVLREELKLKGYSTPQMDRLTARLRGHGGTRTSTYGAGFKFVQTANHLAWDPLFGIQ